MSGDGDVQAWLRERGAEAIDHPGGTLYTHLCRVRDRLAGLGATPDLRLAGLTHAAYGTDGFDSTLLDRADRGVLRDLIGPDAEALVYLYGACDRRRTWRTLAGTATVVDRFTGRSTVLGPSQLGPFVDLSVVNELDVMEQDPSLLDRYGGYFRELFAAWRPVASPRVAAEVRDVPGR
ncbi:DUF6817 domain-containing protein [Plantactinospora sonchi]|uniref:DUF6817 domain-containing protein n=1 Tax=Plantactinospora sonchi TaxID=1544735 RepID=A0ABU7S5B9_9ACTN